MRAYINYATIVAAVDGDEDAMQQILHYYGRYIGAVATRQCFDIDAFNHMEAKLLEALFKFEIGERYNAV